MLRFGSRSSLLLPLALAACSGSAPSATGRSNEPHVRLAPQAGPQVATQAGGRQAPERQAPEQRAGEPEPLAQAAPACPADMALIDGDYCETLEVDCQKSWHAPQNHLYVCEEVAQPTRCLKMGNRKRYCIDQFEFPNRRGVRPMVMQNFYQAQLHCAARSKRVCTESEWTMACEGPSRTPFPYGYRRDPTKCRGDQRWDFPSKQKLLDRDPVELERLWQGVPSGSQPDCVSEAGVHDLPGNADELAASEGTGPADFDNVTTGGPWYLGVRNMCRPKIRSHDESFAYYYLSWRCCQEPDGAATEPRSPRQLARGESWDKVVWRAHHSWKLPFNPKVPGDAGYEAAGTDRVRPEAETP